MTYRKTLCLPIILLAFSAAAQTAAVIKHQEVKAFPLTDVTLTGGDFYKAGETDKEVMLSIVPDRLLYSFRKNAGIPNKEDVKPYGGWEAPDVALRGHTTGHYLSALSYWYVQSPTPEVKQRIDYIVQSLAECQQKLGNGYLSAFPETDIDLVERTGDGWAPHYTLHKILQGLLDAYNLAGNKQALDVAVKMGDWLSKRAEAITDKEHWAVVLDKIEQGGINESLWNLYAITGNERYKRTADLFEQSSKISPAMKGQDVLNRPITPNYQHANATIPQFIGAERKYELTGDKNYLNAATFFWNRVANHRAFSNGGTGFNEYWFHGADTLYPELGIKAGETCATYNMIKLSNDLFRMQPDSKYGDYVERALYNDILSSQHPENGGMMYFHTQEPGGFKTYGKNLEVFWCCTGTGMEDHVRYAESIYFHDDNALYVNLYVPSTVNWKEKSVSITQQTTFPEEKSSSFIIKGKSATYTINFRVPYWAKGEMLVGVNEKWVSVKPNAAGFIALKRTWKEGDVVYVTLPMRLHLEKLPDAPNYATVMCGPLVMAGELGREKMDDSLIMTTDYFFGDLPAAYAAKIDVPSLTGSTTDLSWIRQDANDPLAFFTKETSNHQAVKLVPVYRIFDQRFTSYWKFDGDKH